MEKNVGVIARVPLDEGALTGAIDEQTTFENDDFRAAYFRGDRKRQVSQRVRALQNDLRDCASGLPEIAIRFCLSHPAVTAVIPGMRRPQHVESNVRAAAAGPLPSEILDLLERHRGSAIFIVSESRGSRFRKKRPTAEIHSSSFHDKSLSNPRPSGQGRRQKAAGSRFVNAMKKAEMKRSG